MGELHFRIIGLSEEQVRRWENPQRTRSIPRRVFWGATLVAASIYAITYPGKFSLSPESKTLSTYEPSVRLVGSVGNQRIKEVTLTVNGYPQKAPVSNGQFHATAPLAPGVNLIQASIGGVAGHLAPGSNIVRLTRQLPNDGPLLLPTGRSVKPGSSDSGTFGAQSFQISIGNPPDPSQTYGMVGGGGYYLADITIAPRYEAPGDGSVRIMLGRDQVANKVQARRDPGGLALISWSISLSDLDDPSSLFKEVRVRFDHTAVIADPLGSGVFKAYVPRGATRLLGVEADWKWEQIRKTLSFR